MAVRGYSYNLRGVVDSDSFYEIYPGRKAYQIVQVTHGPTIVEKRAAGSPSEATNYVSRIIDSIGLAVGPTRWRAQIDHGSTTVEKGVKKRGVRGP